MFTLLLELPLIQVLQYEYHQFPTALQSKADMMDKQKV